MGGLAPVQSVHGRQRGSARGQKQKISAGKFHLEPPSRFTSLNHLVGQCQQLVGDFEAERLRGSEIDQEGKFRGLLYRQVGRLLAFENAASIDAGQTVRIGYARSVTHQPAGRDELAQDIDRGNSMLGR